MIISIDNGDSVKKLFENQSDTVIISCMHKIMGELYATDSHKTALAHLGDFCFLAGEPDLEIVNFVFDRLNMKFVIFVPDGEGWDELLSSEPVNGKKVIRYGLKKDFGHPEVFDRAKLTKMSEAVPEGYTLRFIDRELYERCRCTDWCRDWVANFPDYELYEKYGLGVCIMKDNEIVAGASSFSGFETGIEIEIDTKTDYRKKGLARICAAKLILACLDRNLYPSWDAANTVSLHLAESLGYTPSGEYVAYYVNRKDK